MSKQAPRTRTRVSGYSLAAENKTTSLPPQTTLGKRKSEALGANIPEEDVELETEANQLLQRFSSKKRRPVVERSRKVRSDTNATTNSSAGDSSAVQSLPADLSATHPFLPDFKTNHPTATSIPKPSTADSLPTNNSIVECSVVDTTADLTGNTSTSPPSRGIALVSSRPPSPVAQAFAQFLSMSPGSHATPHVSICQDTAGHNISFTAVIDKLNTNNPETIGSLQADATYYNHLLQWRDSDWKHFAVELVKVYDALVTALDITASALRHNATPEGKRLYLLLTRLLAYREVYGQNHDYSQVLQKLHEHSTGEILYHGPVAWSRLCPEDRSTPSRADKPAYLRAHTHYPLISEHITQMLQEHDYITSISERCTVSELARAFVERQKERPGRPESGLASCLWDCVCIANATVG